QRRVRLAHLDEHIQRDHLPACPADLEFAKILDPVAGAGIRPYLHAPGAAETDEIIDVYRPGVDAERGEDVIQVHAADRGGGAVDVHSPLQTRRRSGVSPYVR